MSNYQFETFEDFWPFYLSEHQNPTNRALHYIASTCAIVLLLIAILLRKPLIILAIPFLTYSWAWVGHFLIEKNRPATFKHPLWSLMADFKMYYFFLSGKITQELEEKLPFHPR